jgi:hypothetical protein
MGLPKSILIDTNILIHLEDNKEVSGLYSELSRICAESGIQICAHESSVADVNRDKDSARKAISLSKIQKYPQIKRTPIPTAEKAKRFGPINSPNDEVDTDLLITTDIGVADFLVTEDKGIHGRAKMAGISDKVLNVADTVAFLKTLLDTVPVKHANVEDKLCNEFNPEDPFFESLKQDYPGFDAWFKGCMRKQRACWLIRQEHTIGGLIIYKDENRSDPNEKAELDALGVPGDKVLKLCLFKIGENARGEKYGEQLLKKAMGYAYRNKYDTLYLTVFPKHKTLVSLIESLGFIRAKEKGDELVYFKYSKVPPKYPKVSNLDFHIGMWPCIAKTNAKVYCVPIQPDFHRRLFPDASAAYDPPPPDQLSLFTEEGPPKTPGNAIRKVYVSDAPIKEIPEGSILLFYRTKDSVITSVGVCESYQSAKSLEELKNLVGKRSVYSQSELSDRIASKSAAKVLNFYYAKDFERGIPLKELVDFRIMKAQPQSINERPSPAFEILLKNCLGQADQDLFYDV